MSMTDFLVPDHYGVFAAQPLSRSFAFLLKLALLISVVFAVTVALELYSVMPQTEQWITRTMESLSKELPVIEVADGQLVQPAASYVKKFSQFTFIIEPDKEKAPAALMAQKSAAVLTRDSLMVKVERRRGDAEIRSYELKELKYLRIAGIAHGFSFEREKGKPVEWPAARATGMWRSLSRFFIPILLVGMFPYWVAAKLAQVILLFNRVRLSSKEIPILFSLIQKSLCL